MASHEVDYYIGDASRLTGVKIETIRFYEKAGVLTSPKRDQNGYRLYQKAQVEGLMFVKRCRELGFSLGHTRSLLSLADSDGRTCQQISAKAQKRLNEVRAKIEGLRRMERVLEDYVRSCPANASADCPIVKSLSHVVGL